MPVSLSGALPAGDNNGLESIAEALTADQEQGQMIVAMVSCKRVTIHATGRGKKPKVDTTAGILEIEAFPYGSTEWDQARTLLESRRAERTGEWPLALPVPIDE
jgi:hypothetical protein